MAVTDIYIESPPPTIVVTGGPGVPVSVVEVTTPGLQGIPGEAGPTGTTGIQGVQGVQGDVGPIGSAGTGTSEATIAANGLLRSNLGSPTVAEIGMINSQATNKTLFFNPAKIVDEYSLDGVNWLPWGLTDIQKKKLVSGKSALGSIIISKTWNKVRLTFESTTYVYLNWLYLYNETRSQPLSLTIDKSFDGITWTTVVADSGQKNNWPGHMFLPHTTIPFHPTPSPGTHYKYVRVIFNPIFSLNNDMALSNLDWWGGYPATKREIYDWDEERRVTFPAEIKATQYNLSALNTAPASATAAGTFGEVRFTATGIYICITTNTWIKAAAATF